MKSLLLCLLLASTTAQANFFEGLFGAKRDRIKAQIAWTCTSIQYQAQGLHEYPQRENIEVGIRTGDGQTSFSFSPDIFEPGPWVKPQASVSASSCIEDFQKNFRQWLAINQENVCEKDASLCRSEEVFAAFERNLQEKPFAKSARETAALPRFYAGHSFYSGSEARMRETLQSFCAGESQSPLLLTSKAFLSFTKNIASNPMANLENACLDKIEKFNNENKLNPEVACEIAPSLCSRFQQDTRDYAKLANLRDGATAQAPEAEDNWSAYRLGNSEENALIGQKLKEAKLEGGVCRLPFNFDYKGKQPSIMFYDGAVSTALPHIKENWSMRCKKHFLRNYLLNKYINDDPLESSYCRNRGCENIKAAKNIFEENVQDLLANIYGKDTQVAACFSDDGYRDAGMELDDFLKELEDISSCSEIKTGETKVVSGSVTGISADYALEKLDAKNYKATIAVDFQNKTSGANVSGEQMFVRAKQCMDKVSDYLRSPSGEKLQVSLVSPKEALRIPSSKRPVTHDVDIKPDGFRSNSRNYEETIDCPTITHEVLHLMGLCDEYREKMNILYVDTETGEVLNGDRDELRELKKKGLAKTVPMYECRAVATVDSVMSNQHGAFENAVASEKTCECQNQDCRDVVNYPDEKARELYTSDVWTAIAYRNQICSFKRLSLEKIASLSDLEDKPMHQIKRDDEQAFVFEHTTIHRDSSQGLGMAGVYRYTCGGCQGEVQCEALSELKDRIRTKKRVSYAYCPLGAKEVDPGAREFASKLIAPYEKSANAATKVEGDRFTLVRLPKRPGSSLLHPAHFARIKHGTCASKVKNYTTCAQYAYTSLPEKNCPDRPAMCEDVNQWLLSEQ